MAKTPYPLPDFPHLEFKRCWALSESVNRNLGQCVAIVNCLGGVPVDPDLQRELRTVSLQRGAVATTAIEGNTLSEAELQIVLAGKELPKSREYQAVEVLNALGLMNRLCQKVVLEGDRTGVSTKLLCDFNRAIGQNLGALYDGVPGKLRRDRRHVGRYLAPPCEAVPDLMERFCDWLRTDFRVEQKTATLPEAIIQAIVAHVYFEWIHPFADGNGRTGRMLEFYLLLSAGMPDISAHVLANHYNQTRTEYIGHFDNARKKRNLSEFLAYAIQGLLDGLQATWNQVQTHTLRVCWEAYVYRVFATYTDYHKRTIFKRRRELALAMPLDRDFSLFELARSSDSLAGEYLKKDLRSLKVDFETILQLQLATAVQPTSPGQDLRYRATIDTLKAQQLAKRIAPR